jgi:hypothetical protein
MASSEGIRGRNDSAAIHKAKRQRELYSLKLYNIVSFSLPFHFRSVSIFTDGGGAIYMYSRRSFTNSVLVGCLWHRVIYLTRAYLLIASGLLS